MDIMSIAQQLISQKLGNNVSSELVASALQGLLGGQSSSSNSGGFDMGSLLSVMNNSGALGDVVGSWLGDGDNTPIDNNTVSELFSSDQIAGFASKLGLNHDNASSVLADVIPNMVDKSSSGGSLLDSVGGIEGAFNIAKKFF